MTRDEAETASLFQSPASSSVERTSVILSMAVLRNRLLYFLSVVVKALSIPKAATSLLFGPARAATWPSRFFARLPGSILPSRSTLHSAGVR